MQGGTVLNNRRYLVSPTPFPLIMVGYPLSETAGGNSPFDASSLSIAFSEDQDFITIYNIQGAPIPVIEVNVFYSTLDQLLLTPLAATHILRRGNLGFYVPIASLYHLPAHIPAPNPLPAKILAPNEDPDQRTIHVAFCGEPMPPDLLRSFFNYRLQANGGGEVSLIFLNVAGTYARVLLSNAAEVALLVDVEPSREVPIELGGRQAWFYHLPQWKLTENERKVFVHFSKDEPVSEAEFFNHFNSTFPPVLQSVQYQPVGPGEEPHTAYLTFYNIITAQNIILLKDFTINANRVRTKVFIPRGGPQ